MRAHRAPNEAQVRLEQMISEVQADPPADELPADQEWIDVSRLPPEPPLVWWRRGRPGRLIERWTPSGGAVRRRLPVAMTIAIAVGAAVAIAITLSTSGHAELPPNLPAAQATSVPSTPADAGSIVVSVVGRVAQPGLVTLPDGARVADALRAAGGPLPDVDLVALNLARRLSDGEQVSVGIAAPPDAGPGAPPGKLDLNTASLSQLDTLPGVGTVTAQRILDWRTKHGRFTSLDQLREVDGIGPARFAQLKGLVMVR